MKVLTVMRHGRAEQPRAWDGDYERRLSAAGEQEVETVAARLREQDLVRGAGCIASAAPRAARTAQLLTARLQLAAAPLLDEGLYLADVGTLVEFIRRRAGDADELLLVGHNPGLSLLVARFGDVRLDELPTAGVTRLALPIGQWTEFGATTGRLTYFDHPLAERPLQRPDGF